MKDIILIIIFLFNVDFFFSKGQNAKLLIKHILKIKYVSYLEYMKKKTQTILKNPSELNDFQRTHRV